METVVGPFMPDEEKLAGIRALLPSTSAGIVLNVADAGPLPAETARAMQDAADWELRTGRVASGALEDRAGRLDEARGAIAAILHADVDRVMIAHSVADALAAHWGQRRTDVGGRGGGSAWRPSSPGGRRPGRRRRCAGATVADRPSRNRCRWSTRWSFRT